MNGIIEGHGSYGIIYSNPRLPYINKYYFKIKNLNNLFEEEPFPYLEENCEDSNFLKYEASKIFYDNESYELELNEYAYLLSNYYLDNQYFNIPLHYGIINKKYIRENIQKFNYNSTKINNLNILNTYLKSSYQITFIKGYNIDNIDVFNNLKKNLNIIYAVKFMNEKKFIFDDIKKDNIIMVNNTFKFCDFSTLLSIDDLDTNIFEKSMLKTIFYYIYNPILNSILYYYLSKKEKKEIKIYELLSIIINNEKKKQNLDYMKFNKFLTKKIYNYIKKFDSSLDIKYIFKNIYFYFYMINHNKYYEMTILEFIKYFDNKYNKDIELIINELISRINIYGLGIIFLQYIDLYIQQKNIYNTIFVRKLFKIYKLCSMQINIVNEENRTGDNQNSDNENNNSEYNENNNSEYNENNSDNNNDDDNNSDNESNSDNDDNNENDYKKNNNHNNYDDYVEILDINIEDVINELI